MQTCPDDKLNALIAMAGSSTATRELDALLSRYADPRLHFLKGSWLAGDGEYAAARSAMRAALELAPAYAIARFQLGLLELTCAGPYAALETWGPLRILPPENPLRDFVEGLTHLIEDRFDAALMCLEKGIVHNRDNAALNQNMALVVDAIRARPASHSSGTLTDAVGMLLRQATLKTRH